MDKQLKHRINAGRFAVKNQVEFFKRQFGQVASEWKEDDTRVTFVDFAISEKILVELRRSFPGDDYCSEEGNPQDEVLPLRAKFSWMLDPIDGTNNYALGIPICGISLALLREGIPIYGFLYDMSRDRLVEGGAGLGLFENEKRIPESHPPFGPQSITGAAFPLPEDLYVKLKPLLTECKIRSIGSGALSLAYAATGSLDGTFDHKVRAWDIAAGYALAAAANRPFHFIGKSIFPMTEFHVSQPRCPFFAGTPAFCETMKRWLDQ